MAEAITCGVPVIVTDQCGIAPYVKDRVGFVVPCEVEALREALHRMLADGALRKKFRCNTAQLTRELSWDEPIALMETLYLQLSVKAHSRESSVLG